MVPVVLEVSVREIIDHQGLLVERVRSRLNCARLMPQVVPLVMPDLRELFLVGSILILAVLEQERLGSLALVLELDHIWEASIFLDFEALHNDMLTLVFFVAVSMFTLSGLAPKDVVHVLLRLVLVDAQIGHLHQSLFLLWLADVSHSLWNTRHRDLPHSLLAHDRAFVVVVVVVLLEAAVRSEVDLLSRSYLTMSIKRPEPLLNVD